VTFNRTAEGYLDFRRFGGTLHHRTAFAGATTGQQMLYALDEQVRRHEAAGLVTKYEGWELSGAVLDEAGRCRGITATQAGRIVPSEDGLQILRLQQRYPVLRPARGGSGRVGSGGLLQDRGPGRCSGCSATRAGKTR
jgi:aspartate oxidase